MRRSLRHPIRGDRMHRKPPRAPRGGQRPTELRGGPRMRPRRSVNVAALVGSPEDEPSRPNLRLRVVGVVVVILFGVLVLRLWTLQVVDARSYAAAVTRNQIRVVTVAAPRGQIVDRANTTLVTNVPEQVILLSRAEAQLHPSIIGKVAALVGQTPQQVTQATNNNRYSPYEPVPVAYNVPPSTVQYLQTNQANYPGVSVETLTQRTYPQGGSLATHVLGYVGDITGTQLKDDPNAGYTQGSQVGQTGIEALYEQYLRGVNGRQALSVNAGGDVVGTVSRTAPQLGDTVVLNIDAGLQATVQADLQQQILVDRQTLDTVDHKIPPAIDGAVIVLNPQNGQVLAMASYPSYDLNDWVGGISTANYNALSAGCTTTNDSVGCPLIDYALDGQYTPGSTFKLITATAALQDGLISPTTPYDDKVTFKIPGCPGPGVTDNTSCTLHDDPGDPGGIYNVSTALSASSDSFFYNLGAMFWDNRAQYGSDAIQNEAAQYGEGQLTGIDLPGEGQGRVDSLQERAKLHQEAPKGFPNPPTWFTADNIEMAFGQGQTVLTPLEQAVAYATFANGGTRYAPEVANQIVNPLTGKVIKQFTPSVTGHVAISPSTYSAILQGLEGVISSRQGTAYADFQGFPANWNLAGKTGTASNSKNQEPNSWFVAFGPNPNPQYLVLAVIDQGGYGAQAAAPLVRNIFNYLVTNPVTGVVTPTPTNPPKLTPPAATPPFGTPASTTTTTAPKKSTTTGSTTTTTAATHATTTTATTTPPTTTTPTTAPGG